MDYNYIESLVISAKSGNKTSKEKLINEFKPFIINFSKKTYIDRYDFEDVQSECYIILLHALDKYNPESHRFVAYATNAIKNSMYALIKKSIKNNQVQGLNTLTFDGDLSSLDKNKSNCIEDNLLFNINTTELFNAIDKLTSSEKELLAFNIFRGNTLKSYAELKNISRSTATKQKGLLYNKLQQIIN
ncbi:sigma-70 family RNA polymerase sigma factor [Clostridium sp. SHJSY1]|uniref:sigma-70 family RNA polymerase sigma factor n=1 Tax=Clostridium sp. SHJSY1 TaxID=2942483 RepID=UPI002875500E|nr:sigma-70 family RNA polymerase sigma factor [Clostridium sp. SHJSY1]MDS0527680.1 sigma-70 family RNA polymerase sigma factor [Clostridium sp. SHJSY1]